MPEIMTTKEVAKYLRLGIPPRDRKGVATEATSYPDLY